MPEKVLVVEDDPKLLNILGKILNHHGYQTTLARNGKQGWDLALESPPDMILTDVYMPEMTGLELCRHIKHSRLTAGVPVIIITASDEAPDRVKVFEYGANAWIRKPFRTDAVIATMEEVFKEQKLLKKEKVLGGWIDFSLKSTESVLKSLNLFIQNLLMYSPLPENKIQQLGFSLNELILNAMEHGNQFQIEKQVHISYVLFRERLVIKIKDDGQGFAHLTLQNPLSAPREVALMREREGKRPGGYGIALSRKFLDGLTFNEKGNEILVTQLF